MPPPKKHAAKKQDESKFVEKCSKPAFLPWLPMGPWARGRRRGGGQRGQGGPRGLTGPGRHLRRHGPDACGCGGRTSRANRKNLKNNSKPPYQTIEQVLEGFELQRDSLRKPAPHRYPLPITPSPTNPHPISWA